MYSRESVDLRTFLSEIRFELHSTAPCDPGSKLSSEMKHSDLSQNIFYRNDKFLFDDSSMSKKTMNFDS